ncbi:hypothetical protein QYM36_009320 [Artemia franciscana]|uniref:Integrin beta n=1 Tax=Artemia franciscana TaxID=6661 RepID=A0AA88L1T6_ARTSF|nr:hypothetical protein QYM36_009320 [Artemia franciscana]
MTKLVLLFFALGISLGQDGPNRGDTAKSRSLVEDISGDICSRGVTNCGECLQKPGCVWCADKQVGDKTRVRCKPAFSENECAKVVNLIPSVKEIAQTGTYLSPKNIKASLRRDQPLNMTIKYVQEDFPVDLYVLLDLSYSMKDDKDKLSTLGGAIAEEMRNITKDFRLGFGSFVDKTVLPFARPVLSQMDIDKGITVLTYGFKHHLTLTDDAVAFEEKVKATSVSTNIDSPEGGLEALVQAIVCNEIGWRKESRKLIILCTDADYHAAGDGKLGGIIIPNDGKCHLSKIPGTEEYNYDWVNKHDYPSVGQLAYIASKNRANIIFAATREKVDVYKRLAAEINGASSAQLTDDSSNIVEVVKKEYQKMSGTIILQDEDTPSHISLKYFVKCGQESDFKERRGCDNVKKGEELEFRVQIALTKCLSGDTRDVFKISPVGLQEEVSIEVISMCECPCASYPEINSPTCLGRGNLSCGICECAPLYSGNTCECDIADISDKGDECKQEGDQIECGGRGECKCGKCDCKSRYSGNYCECDNESCTRRNDELCSGEGNSRAS